MWLERAVRKTRSWKVLTSKVQIEIGKNEVGKFGLKLEISSRSWKVWAEVGKSGLKLESFDLTRKKSSNFESCCLI